MLAQIKRPIAALALVTAALADNPETRLEIVPFRGIKLAFVISWAGSLLLIYGWKHLETWAQRTVKHWEILAGAVLAAVVGYALVRSGNASAGWKSSLEQVSREKLESIWSARPRFKEFMIGHPLLIIGLYWESLRRWTRATCGSRSGPGTSSNRLSPRS